MPANPRPVQQAPYPTTPSAARTEDLASCATAGIAVPIRTIMPAPGLFGSDGVYWRSVYWVGDAQLAAQREAELREKKEWKAKVPLTVSADG